MRLDRETVAALDAMADHRQLDFTGMCGKVFDAALRARQRACSQTHVPDQRCGECGLLFIPGSNGSPLENI